VCPSTGRAHMGHPSYMPCPCCLGALEIPLEWPISSRAGLYSRLCDWRFAPERLKGKDPHEFKDTDRCPTHQRPPK
jgi:hypothetical protein